MVRQRVRIRFSKQQDLRFVGHLDLVRCVERVFRRAGVPLAMSEGYHPKPRMTFPAALAVGIEGTDEVMEVELSEALAADELRARLAPHLPQGLSIGAIEVLPPGSRKARVRSFRYRASVPASLRPTVAAGIARLWAASSWPLARPDGKKAVDLRAMLEELTLAEDTLHLRLRAGQSGEGSAGPRDVLAALGVGDLEQQGVILVRAMVEIA